MQDLSNKQHFIGCDVSKNTLDFAVFVPGTDYRRFSHIQVSNDSTGFKQMVKWLKGQKISASKAVIAFEHTGFYSVALSEWLDRRKITFCLLHPLDVKNACSRGRNKNDKADAQFIADYVYTMREKLQPSAPEPPAIRKLRDLIKERRLIVRTRTSMLCQIKTMTGAGSLGRLRRAIAFMSEQIKRIEQEIKETIASDPSLSANYKLLTSITGVGLVNAVNTLVATSNFMRFHTARQYAKFCCVSPMTNQSGTSVNGGPHVSKRGHGELKADLSEAARTAVMHDPQLKSYYERKRGLGKSHGCVMNAVKFKLICRMFAVIERQQPYVDIEGYKSKKSLRI